MALPEETSGGRDSSGSVHAGHQNLHPLPPAPAVRANNHSLAKAGLSNVSVVKLNKSREQLPTGAILISTFKKRDP